MTGSAVAPPWANLGGRLVGVVPVGDEEALALRLEILARLDVPVGEFTDPPGPVRRLRRGPPNPGPRARGRPGVPGLLDAGPPGPGGTPRRRRGRPGRHTRRRHPLDGGQDQTFVAWGIAWPARRMPSGPMVLGLSDARATAPIAHATLGRAANGSGRLSAARGRGRPLTAVVMTINRSPAGHRTGCRTPRTAPTRLPAYEVPSVAPVSHRRPALYTPDGVAASSAPRGPFFTRRPRGNRCDHAGIVREPWSGRP